MDDPASVRASWWEGRHPQSLAYWQTNFPCRAACPVNTNAGGYVSLIAQGRYRDAYLLAREHMSDVNNWLSRAAGWRFGALLFHEPHPARSGELHALVSLLPAELRTAAEPLVADANTRNDDYFAVLGPGGCAATESAYDLAAMANRGPLVAEVSAFYEAFEYPARLTSDLAPDHIFIELDFLGFLALKVAYALYEGRVAEREASSFARAADWVCATLAADVGDRAGLKSCAT